jgi:hypothetical protein
VIYIRQKKANVWGNWMVTPIGGSNPDFSGILKLNTFPILSNNSLETNLLFPDQPTANPAIKADFPVITLYSNTILFNGSGGAGPTYVSFTNGPGGVVYSAAVTTDVLTTTAPSTADNTARVPTTSWVRTNLTDTLNSGVFSNWPQRIANGSYILSLTDAGKHLLHTDSSAMTINIPINSILPFPIGSSFMVVNVGSNIVTITGVGVTINLAGTTSTGNRILSASFPSKAQLLKIGTDRWLIWGEGIT